MGDVFVPSVGQVGVHIHSFMAVLVHLSIYLREAGTGPTGDGKPMGRGPREDSIYMLCLPLKCGSPYWGTGENKGEINNKKNERVMLSL